MGLVIKRKAAPEAVEPTTMLDDIKATDAPAEPVATLQESSPADQTPLEAAVALDPSLPWNEPEPDTGPVTKDTCIVMALSHLAEFHDGTLMLIRIHSGEPFKVLNHNPEDGKTRLEDVNSGRVFDVRITSRENKFYKPMWR